MTSRFFPALAVALGAMAAIAVVFYLGGDQFDAGAMSLGVVAVVLALRNWMVSEEERPLLAEELLGVHENLDALRDDASEMRRMLMELTGIVEDAVKTDASAPSAEAAALTALAARLEHAERRLSDAEAVAQTATQAARDAATQAASAAAKDVAAPAFDAASVLQEITPELERLISARLTSRDEAGATAAELRAQLEAIDQRLSNHDARASKLAQALSLAVKEARSNASRLKRLEARDTSTSAADEAAPPMAAAAGVSVATVGRVAGAPPRLARSQPEAVGVARAATRVSAAAPAPDLYVAQGAAAASTALVEDWVATADAVRTRADATPSLFDTSFTPPLETVVPTTSEAETADDAAPAVERHYELMLQPIFRLEDRTARSFEALPRPQSQAAAEPASDLVGEANVLFVRSVGVLEQMRQADSAANLFCNVSIAALRSETFLQSFLAYLDTNKALAPRLTLEFSQSEIGDVDAADEAILKRIRAAGFHFSLDQVSDWSVDIERLSELGFRYIKLEAGDLLTKLGAAGAAADRLLAAFSDLGLELIVERIATDAQLKALTEAGVGLGQGDALEAPRLVRLD